MRIIVAKTSGFCFGVDHAVKRAYRLLEEQPPVPGGEPYMLGALIHNEEVVDDLKRRGFRLAREVGDLPSGATVMIRAHGVPPSVREALEAREANIVDCTCRFVDKIHRIARDATAEGRRLLVAGDPLHPEVIGIAGECGGGAAVFESAAQAEAFVPEDIPYALVSQTTFSCPWLASHAAAWGGVMHSRPAPASAGSIGPVGPSKPWRPCGPIGPVGPSRPWRPSGPIGPVGPSKPWRPCGPIGPVGPSKPWRP